MKKILTLILFLIAKEGYSQTFYVVHETNGQRETQTELSTVFYYAIDLLESGDYGNYIQQSPNRLTIDDNYSGLKYEIKNLSSIYKQMLSNRELDLNSCVQAHKVVKDKNDLFYSCLIYEIKENKIVPLTKVKITFTNNIKDEFHQVSNIEISELRGKEKKTKSTNDKKFNEAKNHYLYFFIPQPKG